MVSTTSSLLILALAIVVSSILSLKNNDTVKRLQRLLFTNNPPNTHPSCTKSPSSSSSSPPPLRIGILGASTIAKHAILTPSSHLNPCTAHPIITIQGIAARSETKAKSYASKHSIPQTFPSYDSLIRSSDIDAVYIGIPTYYHYKYALMALEEGKHVLVEKPMTVNATEAQRLVKVAEERGVVLMEAFHYKYHYLFRRLMEIVKRGEIIGRVVEYRVLIGMPSFKGVVHRLFSFGGGGGGGGGNGEKENDQKMKATDHEHRKMLDRWCYGLDAILSLHGGGGEEEEEETEENIKNVVVKDATLDAFTANITMDIFYNDNDNVSDEKKTAVPAKIVATKETLSLNWDLVIEGEKGTMEVKNFWLPSVYHDLRITTTTTTTNTSPKNEHDQTMTATTTTSIEKHYGEGEDYGVTTFEMQLRTFVQACQNAQSRRTTATKRTTGIVIAGVKNMEVVDAIFKKAGIHDLSLH